MEEINPDINLSQPRNLLNKLGRAAAFMAGRGPRSQVVQRVGGGVRVAVFPFDPEHPELAVQQTIELKRGRDACQFPFDDPDYVYHSETL